MLAQCTEEGLELSEYVQDPVEKEKLTKAVQELQSGWDNVGKRKKLERGRKGKREGGRETSVNTLKFTLSLFLFLFFPLPPSSSGQLLSDIHQKLTEALLQTQEFQQVADNLERWVNATQTSLKTLEPVAAQVRLIEPQIEGFKVCTCILLLCYSNEIDAL